MRGERLSGITYWHIRCECGLRRLAANWHTALVCALSHAGVLK